MVNVDAAIEQPPVNWIESCDFVAVVEPEDEQAATVAVCQKVNSCPDPLWVAAQRHDGVCLRRRQTLGPMDGIGKVR